MACGGRSAIAIKQIRERQLRERLRGCYLSWSTYNMRRRENRSAMPRKLCSNPLLLDFFPEPAAIRNIREDKLPLVESERIGTVVATER
jgi:hypothetical protein